MRNNTELVASLSQQIAEGTLHLLPRRKTRSNIWNVFSEISQEDGTVVKDFVYCRTCQKVFKYATNQTSNLNKHKCFLLVKEPTDLKKVTSNDKKEAIDVCMQWIIEDCRPLSTITGSGFLKLANFFLKIGAIYGKHVDLVELLPNPTTISSELLQSADEKKLEFGRKISEVVNSGHASATIDMWTDNYVKRNFLGITLHWLEDYQLFDFVLGMKSMDFERSTSEHIIKKLKSLFKEFGVENIKGITYITDTNKNMVKALEHFTRLNCSSHLLADVLDKSFDETPELTDMLEACKNIVKYFKKAKPQHRLITTPKHAYPTRWHTYFTMLQSIVDNWFDINETLAQSEDGQRLIEINISTLTDLVELLKNFETIFKKLQACNSPSLCFVIPSVYKIKALCVKTIDDMPALSALKQRISQNCDCIWVKNLSLHHKAAFFLYPPAVAMQQEDLVEIKKFCLTCIQKFPATVSISDSMDTITIIDTKPFCASPTLDSPCSSNATTVEPTSSTKNDIQFFFSSLLKETTYGAPETPREEVERYSREVVKLTEDFDLIEWWKINSKIYPLLSKLALQIHAMPASSATTERAFSMAGSIITEKRNQLGPKVVDSLMFLHSYYKNFSD